MGRDRRSAGLLVAPRFLAGLLFQELCESTQYCIFSVGHNGQQDVPSSDILLAAGNT